MILTPSLYGYFFSFAVGFASGYITYLCFSEEETIEMTYDDSEYSEEDSSSEEEDDFESSLEEEEDKTDNSSEKQDNIDSKNLENLIKTVKIQAETISELTKENGHPIPNFDPPLNKKICQPDPKEDEIAELFEEEHKRQSTSNFCRLYSEDTKESPVVFHTKPGGGYASFNQIEKARDNHRNHVKKQEISRADELEIMHSYNEIRGMNYHEANNHAKEKGHTLHPVYINHDIKNPATSFSRNVIGVSIEDKNYNTYCHIPSKDAVITDVIDVGGQDSRNRG